MVSSCLNCCVRSQACLGGWRMREAVDALGAEAQRLRADAFMEARRSVER